MKRKKFDQPKIGQPRINQNELQKRRNISLSDRLADKAKKKGDGNISRGIRNLLEDL